MRLHENLCSCFQEFERGLQGEERRMQAAQREFSSLSPGRRSPQVQRKYTAVVETWETLWTQSNTYVER